MNYTIYKLKNNPVFWATLFYIILGASLVIIPYYYYNNPLWFVYEQIKGLSIVLIFMIIGTIITLR